jgi:hypothetical protein
MTKEHYDYLIALRDSGVTNMRGATPYLQDRFDLTRKETSAILVEWIETFKGLQLPRTCYNRYIATERTPWNTTLKQVRRQKGS